MPGSPDPSSKKRAALYGVLAGLAVIAAVLAGLGAAGLLRLNANPAPAGQLQAQASEGPKLLESQTAPAPPALESTAPPKVEMPAAVRDWLEHLRRCENLKNDLHREQASYLSAMAGRLKSGALGLTVQDVDRISSPDGTMANLSILEELNKQLSEMPAKWTELDQFFWSKAPPDADCRRIADAFSQGLREVAATFNDVRQVLSGFAGSGEPSVESQARAESQIRDIGREHPKSLDQAFKDSEQMLAELFKKYDTPQSFHIASDLPGGGLLMK